MTADKVFNDSSKILCIFSFVYFFFFFFFFFFISPLKLFIGTILVGPLINFELSQSDSFKSGEMNYLGETVLMRGHNV